ncbi:MAG: dethiobiotin synthase [Methylococcales bacterium]|nr:dethiobiotin synthase [Methylococcales bacterium]
MKRAYFVTGTDTNVGKTWATLALMTHFKQQNLSVLGMKPVASGCKKVGIKWKNDDALAIQENGSFVVDYKIINPFAYEAPISPHLAGKENPANFDTILANFQTLQNLADVVIVEGAGGWYAPLNEMETIANLAKKLNLPIILVVSIKLGCINHALLTVEAIKNAGLNCVGWLAVCNDTKFDCVDLTIESLKERLEIPLLAIFPYSTEAKRDNVFISEIV